MAFEQKTLTSILTLYFYSLYIRYLYCVLCIYSLNTYFGNQVPVKYLYHLKKLFFLYNSDTSYIYNSSNKSL